MYAMVSDHLFLLLLFISSLLGVLILQIFVFSENEFNLGTFPKDQETKMLLKNDDVLYGSYEFHLQCLCSRFNPFRSFEHHLQFSFILDQSCLSFLRIQNSL